MIVGVSRLCPLAFPALLLALLLGGCRTAAVPAGEDPGPPAAQLETLRKDLSDARRAGDRQGEGDALTRIGIVYDDLGEYAKALEQHQQALVIRRETGDRRGEGTNLSNIGIAYRNLGQYARALEQHQQALAIRREIGDRRGEGATLTNMGIVYFDLGQYARALEQHQQALAIVREIGDRSGEATTLGNIGSVYWGLGQYARALEHYQQALVIDRESGDRKGEGIAIANIGVIHASLGQYAQALEQYQQALAIQREIGDRLGEGNTRGNIGVVHANLGQYARALEHYQQALAIRREIGDRGGEAADLANIGNVQAYLGQDAEALEHYRKALAIQREIGDRQAAAIAIANSGIVYWRLGQYARALEQHQQALAIRREIGDRKGEGDDLTNIGNVQAELGHYLEALEYYRQALAIRREIGDRKGEGVDLANIGYVHADLGQHAEALAHYRAALLVADEVGVPETLWRVNYSLQRTLVALKRPHEAVFYGKTAVNTIQSLRQGASGLERELQRSLVGGKQDVYRSLAELLIEQGRLLEAQQVLAMLKEEEYFDFIRRDAAAADAGTARTAFSRAEAPWAERYEKISSRLASLGREFSGLQRIPPDARTQEQGQRYAELEQDLKAAREAFNKYLSDLEAAFRKQSVARAMDFAAQDLKSLRALQTSLARLGAGAVLLHYLILPEKVHILITTAGAQLHRESRIAEAELNRRVFQYRQVLQDPRLDPRPPAEALYQALIAPVAADLEQAGATTLMLSLDGALRYLPFAALHDGQRYLAQRYGIALFTAAGRVSLERAPAPDWTVAGLGVSEGAEGFAALPAVPVELDEIVRAGDRDTAGILPGVVRLNGAFTAAGLSETLEAGHPVLHLASHFRFTPGTEVDSFLLLGGGQRLTLADFKTGNFPLGRVDLLTLSACETALGDNQNGREIEGFGAMAQNQGAASVMATLWSVADGTTGIFMREFYQRRHGGRLSKAEALRHVQTGFITGAINDRTAPASLRGVLRARPGAAKGAAYRPDPDAPFAHPFFWAPYILMGNWL